MKTPIQHLFLLLACGCLLPTALAKDCSAGMEEAFEMSFFPKIPDPETLLDGEAFSPPINISVDGLIDLQMRCKDLVITGASMITPGACTADDGPTKAIMKIEIPDLQFSFGNYTLEGELVDSIPVAFEGEALVILQNLIVEVIGEVEAWDVDINGNKYIQFSDYTMDMDLERLSIYATSPSSNTDLGTLITEFLMMQGPDIFSLLGQSLSGNKLILRYMNSIYKDPLGPTAGPDTTTPAPTDDGATSTDPPVGSDDPPAPDSSDEDVKELMETIFNAPELETIIRALARKIKAGNRD